MRALNQDGRVLFRKWVLNIGEHAAGAPPREILDDPNLSYRVLGSSDVSPSVFDKKCELAESLLPHIETLEGLGLARDSWPDIWDALALHHFDSICPKSSEGLWQPHRVEHYIYDASYTVRHRHRIYGPVTLWRAGRPHIRPFFNVAPSVLGDFEEQVGSRQELAGNSTALKVLATLYVKKGGESLISGYTNRKSFKGFKRKLPIPGSLRRFTAIYDQLKRTYDLSGISFEGFLDVLPKEFNEWIYT